MHNFTLLLKIVKAARSYVILCVCVCVHVRMCVRVCVCVLVCAWMAFGDKRAVTNVLSLISNVESMVFLYLLCSSYSIRDYVRAEYVPPCLRPPILTREDYVTAWAYRISDSVSPATD